MMKIIKFFASEEYRDFGKPSPTKKHIPEWYRKAESTYDLEGFPSAGLKKCMPYMDSLISGYVLTFPVNVYINEQKNDLGYLFQNSENNLQIRWDGPPEFSDLIMERPIELGSTMPRPAGHYPNHLVFSGKWSIKTPRGWSLLMTPPLNRYDLPFTASSGIIDSDKFTSPGNIPFFIKKGFSGVIPEGTPLVQLIPIKRESWLMSENDKSLEDLRVIERSLIRNPKTEYKHFAWKRKKFD
jgi:hypothetical protein